MPAMMVNGKTIQRVTLEDCMVRCRVPEPQPKRPKVEVVWVAYSGKRPYLPICLASSAQELADYMGVSRGTVTSNWSKFKAGKLKRTRYARVALDDEE